MRGVWISKNTFENLRCLKGCALSATGDLGPQIIITDNKFDNIATSDPLMVNGDHKVTAIELNDVSIADSRGDFPRIVMHKDLFTNI